ncbi:RidA family protein [Clostridiaceae bacterium HSG29]|nr:RidA family protein [Clostridiaceae bacterium HSG29]
MLINDIMKEKNITLPPFNKPAANYSPAIKSGKLVFTAGQTPKYDGVLKYKGKVSNSNFEDGIKAAELCALNCLSVINKYIDGLENIVKIVKVSGFVNAETNFINHAKVLDGATNILSEIFGDNGLPARTAIGVDSLPGDAMVEIEMIVEIL